VRKEVSYAVNKEPQKATNWRDDLMNVLLKMEPGAFERLAQRLLRESGFAQVEVTGRTGDGGLDGRGIVRPDGLLSFQVTFKCMRRQGAVSADDVRDFRTAMAGRADKGLLITTRTFTQDAIREAMRDGAPAVGLIDGEQFLDKLKDLSLGVRARRVEVEQVSINREWFSAI
jgi:restriction system protein